MLNHNDLAKGIKKLLENKLRFDDLFTKGEF